MRRGLSGQRHREGRIRQKEAGVCTEARVMRSFWLLVGGGLEEEEETKTFCNTQARITEEQEKLKGCQDQEAGPDDWFGQSVIT